MNLMQVRGVNAFTCTEAKVSIDHELTHERSTTKGKKYIYEQQNMCLLFATWMLLELKLKLF